MSSLMTLVNGTEQVHHIFEKLASLIPLADTIDSLDNQLINDFTGVSIDEHNPLVNQIPLGPKFDVYGF
jgi:hypothetical protein